MYQRILHDPLLFDVEPEQFSDDVRLALRGMLQRDPLFRITIARLKRSPYLANVSWSLLENKCYDPPFVPELNPLDPTDLSQFDDTFLSMPAQVKGDPEHEPGAGREPPEGEAQPRFDDTGRDVFDGCESCRVSSATRIILLGLIRGYCRLLLRRSRFGLDPRQRPER